MRFQVRLAVPAERAVCKIDMDSETVEQRLPNGCHLLTLGNTVGRNKCTFCVLVLDELGRLEVPIGHIINLSSGFVGLSIFVNIRGKGVFLLGFALKGVAYKRRISQNVVVGDRE